MASGLFQELAHRFSLDGIDIDNWGFKFFSRVTVGIFLVASAASVALSFVGEPIECLDKESDYGAKYCYLPGIKHIPSDKLEKLANKLGASGATSMCSAYDFKYDDDGNLEGVTTDKDVTTTYFIWISLVLFLSAAVFMIPDHLWKYLEGGMLKQFQSGDSDFLEEKQIVK